MSASTWTKKYPPKDGWVRAQLTMRSNQIADKEWVKDFVTGKNPAAYEFAELTQHGTRVVAIYRRRVSVAGPGSEVRS